MAAQKKVLTKGQIVTHFAEKFEISKKAADSMIEEYAALAIAETKKKGPSFFQASVNPFLLKGKPVWVGTPLPAKKSKFRQRLS